MDAQCLVELRERERRRGIRNDFEIAGDLVWFLNLLLEKYDRAKGGWVWFVGEEPSIWCRRPNPYYKPNTLDQEWIHSEGYRARVLDGEITVWMDHCAERNKFTSVYEAGLFIYDWKIRAKEMAAVQSERQTAKVKE